MTRHIKLPLGLALAACALILLLAPVFAGLLHVPLLAVFLLLILLVLIPPVRPRLLLHTSAPLAIVASILLLAVPAFAQTAASAGVSPGTAAAAAVASSTGWLTALVGLFGTALTAIGGVTGFLHIKNLRVLRVMGALERAAGYGFSQAQAQGMDPSKPETLVFMGRKAVGYMMANYGGDLKALGVTVDGQLGSWCSAALGKMLGTGAAPALIGTATTLLQGNSGTTVSVSDLSDSQLVAAVASAVASRLPVAQTDLDALADRVIAKLPVGLQVVAQQGKALADAEVPELVSALSAKMAQPVAAPTPDPASTAAVAAAATAAASGATMDATLAAAGAAAAPAPAPQPAPAAA